MATKREPLDSPWALESIYYYQFYCCPGMNISHENRNFSKIDYIISKLFPHFKKILKTDYSRLLSL